MTAAPATGSTPRPPRPAARIGRAAALAAALGLAAPAGAAGGVTLGTLLGEMTDPERLTRLAAPSYRLLQASSTDRRSQVPDTPAWFDNWDNANFVRTETVGARLEFVLMDAAGPGAIVRFWTTQGIGQPYTLRVYLDGQPDPVIAGDVAQVIGRGALAASPLSFVAPQAATADVGQNLYLPIPFAARCKVTVSTPDNTIAWPDFFFYNVEYRVYEPGTVVESLAAGSPTLYAAAVQAACDALLAGPPPGAGPLATNSLAGALGWGGGERSVALRGPAAIRLLRLRLRAPDLPQALRSTLLELDFDGEARAVRVPVGDFFGTGHHVTTGGTWFAASAADGTLAARWTMPFRARAVVRLVNAGLQDVRVDVGEVVSGAYAWRDDSLHFHAAWRDHAFEDTVAQQGEDLGFASLLGAGRYVGDSLCVYNGAASDVPSGYANWWGEGDEKIFVDGEAFPSHFGTGTEDYYGYAWCRPQAFATPFVAQPLGDGNARRGHTVNTRVRLLDDIPFSSSLRFDMELWSWRTGRHRYAPAVFWYARPGGRCLGPDPRAHAALPVPGADLGFEGAARYCPVGVRREAEALPVLACTGGSAASAAGAGLGLGGDRALAWRGSRVGDRLSLGVTGSFTGACALVVRVIAGPAAGAWRVSLNGQALTNPLSLYAAAAQPRVCELGGTGVRQGANTLEWETVAAAEGAETADLVLDWVANRGPFHVARATPVVRERLEGEALAAAATGGALTRGPAACAQSQGAGLRWSGATVGDACTIDLTLAEPRQVALNGLLVGGTNAPLCDLSINGGCVAAGVDLRRGGASVTNLFLGEHALPAGTSALTLRIVGCAPGLDPSALALGVDAVDIGSIYARRAARSVSPLAGPDEDADGDGLSNLGEHAFGGDPLAADAAALWPRPRLWREGGATYPAIAYRRRAPDGALPVLGEEGIDLQVDGVQYRVQAAVSLEGACAWYTTNGPGAGVAACEVKPGPGGVDVCVRDTTPLAAPDSPTRFLRVGLQEP